MSEQIGGAWGVCFTVTAQPVFTKKSKGSGDVDAGAADAGDAGFGAVDDSNTQVIVNQSSAQNGAGGDCGADGRCRPCTPAWKIIVVFLSKTTTIVTAFIVIALFIIYIRDSACETCHPVEAPAEKQNLFFPDSLKELNGVVEGGPCRRMVNGFCVEAETVRHAMRWARYYLRRGDAESALIFSSEDEALKGFAKERENTARDHYRAAIDIGSGVGSQAAIYAAKRLQFLSMTCQYNEESLARISRDWNKNVLGALIEMKQKQRALKALGYYNGDVDNRHGAQTRLAVRDFQGDLGSDQTGVLSAEQTALLICAGAQIAKNIDSQNVLGIMYATGLGVKQNTDFALNWLEAAAQRGDADASWNLAMMYGTKTVLSSVLICDAVQNAERADSYLREAANAGHPAAKVAARKYKNDTPELRWRKLSGDLNRPEIVDRVGRGCNPND
ncbi:MAG: tetratricopeptide repeat protein [Pseudomonadota bacterium]